MSPFDEVRFFDPNAFEMNIFAAVPTMGQFVNFLESNEAVGPVNPLTILRERRRELP